MNSITRWYFDDGKIKTETRDGDSVEELMPTLKFAADTSLYDLRLELSDLDDVGDAINLLITMANNMRDEFEG